MVTNLVSIGFYLTSATFARLSSRISFKVYFYLGKNLYDAKCNMKYSELWFLWDISMQDTLLRLLLQISLLPQRACAMETCEIDILVTTSCV